MDERVAPRHDRLDPGTFEREHRLLARAARAPTVPRHHHGGAFPRAPREFGPHVVERFCAQLGEGGEMAEFARDDRVGVDVVAEALHAALDRPALPRGPIRAARFLCRGRQRRSGG